MGCAEADESCPVSSRVENRKASGPGQPCGLYGAKLSTNCVSIVTDTGDTKRMGCGDLNEQCPPSYGAFKPLVLGW